MQRRFPWLSLIAMILPVVAILFLGLQTGAFYRDFGPNDALIWRTNPEWFSDNFIVIAVVTVVCIVPGLLGFLRKWRAHRDFERFDEDGYLTYATLRDIRWGARGKATVGLTTIQGDELELKDLPESALRGRSEGDQLPIYALPNEPNRVVWAGDIDPPNQHTLAPRHDDESGLAWRDAQTRQDMQAKKHAAEKWIRDLVTRGIPNEVVEDALSRSKSGEGATSDAPAGGAIHTKFVRLSFFDFFIIPFMLVHGSVFLVTGLSLGTRPDTPAALGGIFALVGLVEMAVLGVMTVRVVRKLGRHNKLTVNGIQKSAIYLGSTGTNVRVNGVPRRAMILEIDGERYQHGNFGPRRIAHLREGQSLEILQDRDDPRVVFVQSL